MGDRLISVPESPSETKVVLSLARMLPLGGVAHVLPRCLRARVGTDASDYRSVKKVPIMLIMLMTWTLTASAETPFIGRPIKGTEIVCQSSESVAAGYWRKDGRVVKDANISAAPLTTWIIIIKGDTAFVSQAGKATVNPDDLTKFTIERAYGGWQLIEKDREFGVSPETITIDPANGSFVYVVQHADGFWNRANVFIGFCQDAPTK